MPDCSLLDAPERHPLCPPEAVRALGTVVVVAPHADDESLGAGGLLALLAEAGRAAHVVVVTDGSASHPGSVLFPPARLAALREAEAAEAVAALGHAGRVHFLRLADGALPAPGTDAFEHAADRLAALMAGLGADTLVAPWRRDPHPDHEATWRLAHARRDPAVRWIEYPVWAWARGDAPPTDADATAWRLDTARVMDRKAAAIAAHRSQYAGIITDSPDAFQLSDAVLAHFQRPWELFLDPHAAAPCARERPVRSRKRVSISTRTMTGDVPQQPPSTGDRTPGGSIAPAYFERLYASDPDPWQFATSPYEAAKYAATLAALPRDRYGSAFEIGCAGGVLSRQLAEHCDRMLAVDVSDGVLAQARARCADQPHVTFQQMTVPGEWPDESFGLVVLSEVGYYLGDGDFAALGERLDASVEPGGHLVLVHWTGPTDYPRTGDAVHDAFLARPAWRRLGGVREADYRLDVLERV